MIYTLAYTYILYVYNKGIQIYIDSIRYFYYFISYTFTHLYTYSYTIHTIAYRQYHILVLYITI